jgi:hypothetical protein
MSIRPATIEELADEAALTTAQTLEEVPNPFEAGTESAKLWQRAYHRQLLLHTAPKEATAVGAACQ